MEFIKKNEKYNNKEIIIIVLMPKTQTEIVKSFVINIKDIKDIKKINKENIINMSLSPQENFEIKEIILKNNSVNIQINDSENQEE